MTDKLRLLFKISSVSEMVESHFETTRRVVCNKVVASKEDAKSHIQFRC